jgi:hypothetical protein
MAPVPGRTLRRPAKVDTGFAIGSMLRLQVPRLRMANGWALGQFGGEFGQGARCFQDFWLPSGSPVGHKNRKTPISKPAANAQRPSVQAETRRTRLRRSCGTSWDRSVIAAAPPSQQLLGLSFIGPAASRRAGHCIQAKPKFRLRLSGFRHGVAPGYSVNTAYGNLDWKSFGWSRPGDGSGSHH